MFNNKKEIKMVINNNTKIEILEKKNSTTKLKIDGIVYYAKKDPNFYEVICSEIAKVCGLKCFSYEPIVINNDQPQAAKKSVFCIPAT